MAFDKHWGTHSELKFIRLLGTGLFSELKTQRKRLLEGYFNGCEGRDVWGNIDRNEVLKFAEHELEAERMRE